MIWKLKCKSTIVFSSPSALRNSWNSQSSAKWCLVFTYINIWTTRRLTPNFFTTKLTWLKIKKWYHRVDGRNPANQLILKKYSIIYRVLYIPGDSEFLPSTVLSLQRSFWDIQFLQTFWSTASAGNLNDKVPHPSPHDRSQTHAYHFDFLWIWHCRHAFWGNLIFTNLYSRSPCWQLCAGRKLLSENGLKYDLWTPQCHETIVTQDMKAMVPWNKTSAAEGKPCTFNRNIDKQLLSITTETFCVV